MTDKKYSIEEVLKNAYDAGAARGRADARMGLSRIENEITREAPGKAERQEYIDPNAPAVGRWYWVTTEEDVRNEQGEYVKDPNDKDEWLKAPMRWIACVVHVGSNFATLEGPGPYGPRGDSDYKSNYAIRFHMDEWDQLVPEPNAQAEIDRQISKHQRKAGQLMASVQEITARLGLSMGTRALGEGETAALSLRGDGSAITGYKADLIKAKDQDLPELFKQIKIENTKMGKWMCAALIPLEAEAEKLKPTIKLIESRIFNVELYAGLIEEVEQVREGKPAALSEKLHLFQRRAYMDEECLLDYQTGGMEFKNIGEFDKWIGKQINLDRLLPFHRCLLAFRVRRNTKERETRSIRDFINLGALVDADKLTFIYIRNGEQLFRLNTGIEFGAELFPDHEAGSLLGPLMAAKTESNRSGSKAWDIITVNAWEVMKQEEKRARADLPARLAVYKAEKAEAFKAAVAKWEADELLGKNKKIYSRIIKPTLDNWESRDGFWTGKDEGEDNDRGYHSKPSAPHEYSKQYKPFTPDNIDFDAITAALKEQMDRHNRLVLVLQGLLDRSPVLHPHPAVQLWMPEGFEKMLDLVYDVTRTLNPTEKPPDFEAYRARCNASLGSKSVTIGQHHVWAERERERERERRESDYRLRYDEKNVSDHWTPQGDPGPGVIAKAVNVSKKGFTFKWQKERGEISWETERLYRKRPWLRGKRKTGPIEKKITVKPADLFNVSAYKPGDFRQFFLDHRTRADYLKWAPLLLEAEEYHAGNRKLGSGGSEIVTEGEEVIVEEIDNSIAVADDDNDDDYESDESESEETES